MTLVLRRTVFGVGERRPDDYEVRHDGQTIGRIYRMRRTGRELWRWRQSGLAQPSHGENGGVADTLDEAKATFRAGVGASAVGRSGPNMLSLSISAHDPERTMGDCAREGKRRINTRPRDSPIMAYSGRLPPSSPPREQAAASGNEAG
jgi:hypothetical protein